MSEVYDGYFFFTIPQYATFVAAGMFSCSLSICGSATIVFLILKSKHRMQEVYHRLVFGMSISDLFVTISLFLQSFLMPSETGFPLAIGNQTTCNVLGFMAPFFATSYCYSCFLGVYFMMMVRQNRKEKEIAQLLEPWVHIVAWGFPLVYAVVCVSMKLINPNPFLAICNPIPYPIECTFLDDVECTRAEMASYIVPIHDGVSLLYVVTGGVCTWLVYWTVRKQSRTMVQYSVDGQVAETQRRRERAVAIQAICFAGAYFIGFATVLSVEVLKAIYTPRLEGIEDLGDYPVYFAAMFFIWLFFPMQGFFNCIIYIRPRYSRWRNYFPEKSWLWALRMVVTGQTSPPGGWSTAAGSTRLNRSSRDLTNASQSRSFYRPRATKSSFDGSIGLEEPGSPQMEKAGADLEVTRTATLSPLQHSTASEGISTVEELELEEHGLGLNELVDLARKQNDELESPNQAEDIAPRQVPNPLKTNDDNSRMLRELDSPCKDSQRGSSRVSFDGSITCLNE